MQEKFNALIIIGTKKPLHHRASQNQSISTTPEDQTLLVPKSINSQTIIPPLSPHALTELQANSWYCANPGETWSPIKKYLARNPLISYLSIEHLNESYIKISHQHISIIHAANCVNLRWLELDVPLEKLDISGCTFLEKITFLNPKHLEKLKVVYANGCQKQLILTLRRLFPIIEIIISEASHLSNSLVS